MRNIFVYPEVTEQGELNDLLSRMAWYFRPYLSEILAFRLSCANTDMLRKVQLSDHLDPVISQNIPDIVGKVHRHSPEGLTRVIKDADPQNDILLIWDVEAEKSAPALLKKQFLEFSKNSALYRVDPKRTRQEGSFYLWSGLNKFGDGRKLLKTNKEKLDQMVAEIGQHKKAYVFGTGPSFSDFVEGHDFSDGLCIAANSIVKNDMALERLKPRIICAADPIYHAGCSSYAGAFRETLESALEKTGAWFLCPMRDLAIYKSFLPPKYHDHLIGIPFDKTKPVSTDLTDEFHLHPYPNVLTLMLLPLASTFANDIRIVGCDGRKLLNDSFFWSHDKKVQFNDQMSEIQAAHPGFFNIDYNDYYTEHCRDLENVLARLESSGKTVVTETPSLIPALNHREISTIDPEPLAAIAMIDPDAKDDWGHFLAYDKRVSDAVNDKSLNFALICRKELETRFMPRGTSAFLPKFSVHSWTVGNKTPAKREDVLQFIRELGDAMQELETRYPTGKICLFFYVGSIEVAEALEYLLIEHPRFTAVINLFWSYNFDEQDPSYKARWQPVLRRIHAGKRLQLTHATGQIARDFKANWGVDVPVLEHPSTTFSDRDAAKLSEVAISRKAADKKRMRVVFPGGARAEKGFELSVGAVDLLRADKNVDLALRSRLDNVSGKALHDCFDGLDKKGIEIIDQDLSDDEFIGMIENADIIVVPYHASAFRRRTSGILVDAMLLGKPVVVLQDTWLADIVKEEHTGVCVEPTAEGIAKGVQDIVKRYGEFADHIETARHKYLEANSWKALVGKICDQVSEVAPANIESRANMTTEEFLDHLARSVTKENSQSFINLCAAALLLNADSVTTKMANGSQLRDSVNKALRLLPQSSETRQHFMRVRQYTETEHFFEDSR